MKLAQLLLKALTGIGDDLVEEAARPAIPRPGWLRLLPWATLFALLVGGALALQHRTQSRPGGTVIHPQSAGR